MRLNEGVEWALHSCLLLASAAPRSLSAAQLAAFHDLPGHYHAKHLQALARASILTSVPGPGGGYRLARPPEAITVLDVVEAVEGAGATFRCQEIRQRGPAALPASCYRQRCAIARAMADADAQWRATLRDRTLADLVAAVPRRARQAEHEWLATLP